MEINKTLLDEYKDEFHKLSMNIIENSFIELDTPLRWADNLKVDLSQELKDFYDGMHYEEKIKVESECLKKVLDTVRNTEELLILNYNDEMVFIVNKHYYEENPEEFSLYTINKHLG